MSYYIFILQTTDVKVKRAKRWAYDSSWQNNDYGSDNSYNGYNSGSYAGSSGGVFSGGSGGGGGGGGGSGSSGISEARARQIAVSIKTFTVMNYASENRNLV